jgi:hypothetical protein
MALIFAALLPADHVALPWVRLLAAQAFPDLGKHGSHNPSDPWQYLLQRLSGLRLLQPGEQPHEARMHQLVQKIVRKNLGGARHCLLFYEPDLPRRLCSPMTYVAGN